MKTEIFKDIIFSVVDLETSDLSFAKAEILEICILQIKNNKFINEYETLIRPSKKVKLSTIEIHGIDNDMLMTAPDKMFIMPKIIALLKNTILVEHNLNNFDSTMLELFLNICPWRKTLNTITLARMLMPGLKHYNLRNICKKLSIDIAEQHTARIDADATAKLLLKLFDKIQSEQLFVDEIIKMIGV